MVDRLHKSLLPVCLYRYFLAMPRSGKKREGLIYTLKLSLHTPPHNERIIDRCLQVVGIFATKQQ
jgi:hypothetical protein